MIIQSIRGTWSRAAHSASLGYIFILLKPSSAELCDLVDKLQRQGRSAAAAGVSQTKSIRTCQDMTSLTALEGARTGGLAAATSHLLGGVHRRLSLPASWSKRLHD